VSTNIGMCPHCGGAGIRAAIAAYDCHGGPGTTQEPCGACITCLHRVIEEKDKCIATLEAEVIAARELAAQGGLS